MKVLTNKRAVITGASRGIGKSIAINLAENGCDLILLSRTQTDLDEVKEYLLDKYEVNVISYAVDISNYKEVENIFNTIAKESQIDILVNNAGITRDNILARMSQNEWNDVINTNLTGYFNCCKCIIKTMMKQRYGRIINISSIVGINGNSGQVNYAASKAGIIGLTKSLSKEVGSRNITVNAIAPGFIKTEMTNLLTHDNQKQFLDSISLNRFGKSEDVSNMVTFLASDKASYITGQIINIDGGIN